MPDDFPEDLKQFLAGHLSSVAQLETLLLLRSGRDREWTPEDVSRSLYTTAEMAADQLSELHARGLVACKEESGVRFQYLPATAELEAQVGRLETMYRERRVAVITAIYSQPLDKVRTFADAFRLRKDK
jgi:hypothetical protein